MYDEKVNEMLFALDSTILDNVSHYMRSEEMVAIRDVSTSYAKFLNGFKEMSVWITGYDELTGNLIAEAPDKACLRESIKYKAA
jgi:hypothetical protein